jgi:hypothetical protein
MGDFAAQASATARPAVEFERLPELVIEDINGHGDDMLSHGGFKRFIMGEDEPYGDDEHDEGYYSDNDGDGDDHDGDGGGINLQLTASLHSYHVPAF